MRLLSLKILFELALLCYIELIVFRRTSYPILCSFLVAINSVFTYFVYWQKSKYFQTNHSTFGGLIMYSMVRLEEYHANQLNIALFP